MRVLTNDFHHQKMQPPEILPKTNGDGVLEYRKNNINQSIKNGSALTEEVNKEITRKYKIAAQQKIS